LESQNVVEGVHAISGLNVELRNLEIHASCQIGINERGNEGHWIGVMMHGTRGFRA